MPSPLPLLPPEVSPLEALAERTNWLSSPPSEDPFGQELLASGVSEAAVRAWFEDPPLLDVEGAASGGGQGLFDFLEDRDATDTALHLMAQHTATQGSAKKEEL